METVYSIKPVLAPLLSLILPFFIVTSAKKPNLREAWTFAFAGIKFCIIASLTPQILAGSNIEYSLCSVLPGIDIKFKVDAFGQLFALVSSFLWIVTTIYSVGYMRGLSEHAQTRYYCFFSLSLSSAVGVAFAGNLLTMYLFYEALSFATYPLVTHHQDQEARSSGRRYLFFIVGASIGLALPAMIYVYSISGTLDFAAHGVLPQDTPFVTALILCLLFMFGFAKAGIMPMHAWLPAAMVAPTPVSALLHAVAVVKVGVFCVLRVHSNILGIPLLSGLALHPILSGIAAVTILTASAIALSQDGLKRRLAFSTIGQLSYIILGMALLTPAGLTGGMLHIAMHAFGKITLFFCAGAIFVSTGIKNISQMTGIGRRMPFTMAAFFIGSLSVIGIPPTGGFISKWHLLLGTLESGQMVMLVVLLTSSLLNAAYFLPIVYRAFFVSDEEASFEKKIIEAPRWCLVPPVITAGITIILFFYPKPFYTLARMAAHMFTNGG
ncbi:monovalent cation/H+ antiporter subunit D family protein [Desulfobacterales bacterium HSG17]|nr:monovalent cation/H+ antiporter subunit D family protein [Desulfobacterales bacterium HSG17]